MKKVLYLVATVLLGIIIWNVFGTNKENFNQKIEQERKTRLHFLLNSSSSPVSDKSTFVHPGFFEAQKKYRVTGNVNLNPKNQQIALPLSGGKVETYIHYGDIDFNLDNSQHTLVLYQNLENNSEFLIPFGDNTNGKTTYGAGRHLPINYSGGEHIILDFNLSENPYCAYNHSYSCPLPPKDNILQLDINAGEQYQ